MPCTKYSGAQRRACFATDGWKKPSKSGGGAKGAKGAKKPRVKRK